MSVVRDISENTPHRGMEVVCLKCLRRWWAVYPVDVPLKNLHCKDCGPGNVIGTGEPIPNTAES